MNDPNSNQEMSSGGAGNTPGKAVQRWRAASKREVVVRLLRGEPIGVVSRQLGVEACRLERWRDRALAGMNAGLKERSEGDPVQTRLDDASMHNSRHSQAEIRRIQPAPFQQDTSRD